MMKTADIDSVAKIWLDGNIKAHGFISARYWTGIFDSVKKMFPQAEVYVYEDENSRNIQGFIGLQSDYVAGIFVAEGMRSRGIGKRLVDYAKNKRDSLQLSVYQKNTRAADFYKREGFCVQCEGTDDNTGEKEYVMIWKRQG